MYPESEQSRLARQNREANEAIRHYFLLSYYLDTNPIDNAMAEWRKALVIDHFKHARACWFLAFN